MLLGAGSDGVDILGENAGGIRRHSGRSAAVITAWYYSNSMSTRNSPPGVLAVPPDFYGLAEWHIDRYDRCEEDHRVTRLGNTAYCTLPCVTSKLLRFF